MSLTGGDQSGIIGLDREVPRPEGVPSDAGPTWIPIDDHPAVRRTDNPSGVLGRDAVYRLAREGRIRCLFISRRRWLVHRDLLDDIALSGKPL